MYSVIYHLISSVCLNDSDKWFSILGVHEPNDLDLETFLDMVDKTEEIVNELQGHQDLETSTEMSTTQIKELASMIYNLQKIKSELAMLVHQMTQGGDNF